jgi:hypothetical protein
MDSAARLQNKSEETLMNFDPINKWSPPAPGDQGLGRPSATVKGASGSATHREAGHVPVDKADAEKRERAAASGAEKSTFEQIVEKGFSTFMEEMQAKKLKEMREKILGAMGLTEEMLAKMTPEQRAAVEKAVAEEMRRRLTAAAEISAQEKQTANPQNNHPHDLTKLMNGLAIGPEEIQTSASKGVGIGNGMGLGPLLALQEVEQNIDAERPSKPGQNDRERS